MFAATFTFVPGAQYFSGRQCAFWSSSQYQEPCTGGSVVTLRRRSAAARSGIASSKWATMTMPTPNVPPSPMGAWPGVVRYALVSLLGVIVLNEALVGPLAPVRVRPWAVTV